MFIYVALPPRFLLSQSTDTPIYRSTVVQRPQNPHVIIFLCPLKTNQLNPSRRASALPARQSRLSSRSPRGPSPPRTSPLPSSPSLSPPRPLPLERLIFTPSLSCWPLRLASSSA